MDPKFPMSEIHLLMKFVDVDDDGQVSLEEFKKIFRQFEDEKFEWKVRSPMCVVDETGVRSFARFVHNIVG